MVVLFILPMWVNILIRTLATVALFDFLNLPLECLGNPVMEWETSKQFDLGLDLLLFNNSLEIVQRSYPKTVFPIGYASFLQGPTERTKHIWNLCLKALEEERANNGVRSLDHTTVSTITSHKAGYIDKENELIVGLQTDELLRRAIKPFGGINVVAKAANSG